MTDNADLIERLEQGIDSVFDPDKGIPEAEAIMAEAAAALRKSEVEIERLYKGKALVTRIMNERNETVIRQRETIGKLREALDAFMTRYADDEEAWDAGPLECWVKARAALSTTGGGK